LTITQHPSPAATGLVLTLASAALFGMNTVFARLASFSGVGGTSLVFYRVLLMLALVGAAAALWRASLAVAPGERSALLVAALATGVLGNAYLSSVAFVPVTVAVVVFYTFPVLIVLASPLVTGTPLTPRLLATAGLALLGVGLAVGPAFGDLDPRGLGLAFAASVAAAVQFFAFTRMRRTGLAAKVLWVHLLVLPATALLALGFGGLNAPGDLALAALAAGLSVAGYIVGFALQLAALARTSAVVAGIAYCAEPLVSALGSAAILGESLTGVQWLGGAIVVAAIVANVVREHRAVPLRAESLAEPIP
jgi:drug/metabolite transporter (DMT)-like permease